MDADKSEQPQHKSNPHILACLRMRLCTTMQDNGIGLDDLVKSLADNFNVLADEVQVLSDRKIILEHKLRFAHEQVRYRASSLHHILLETPFHYMMNNIALDLESASALATDKHHVPDFILVHLLISPRSPGHALILIHSTSTLRTSTRHRILRYQLL